MIPPTVGRVLWYYGYDFLGGKHDEKPRAAIIAEVHSNDVVTLTVCQRDGSTSGAGLVTLVQSGGKVPSNMPYCTWMPYQVGQAAKTEAIQKQLDGK